MCVLLSVQCACRDAIERLLLHLCDGEHNRSVVVRWFRLCCAAAIAPKGGKFINMFYLLCREMVFSDVTYGKAARHRHVVD